MTALAKSFSLVVRGIVLTSAPISGSIIERDECPPTLALVNPNEARSCTIRADILRGKASIIDCGFDITGD
jgi:hypothetical protein